MSRQISNKLRNIDLEIADEVSKFYADPLGFTMFAFPWDSDPSIQLVELVEPWASRYNSKYGPDKWVCELFDQIGQEVRERGFDGQTAVDPIQYGVASGHGIGKSACTSWLVLWILSTRPYCKGTVTANTSDQLKTKTWGELGKWRARCITGHWFEYTNTKGNMAVYHKAHKDEWRCDAQTCREENSESFAGQHAANSTSFYINDEASAVPDVIWDVQEGGLTDGEPMRFAFGNPTRNTGRFRECFRKFRHRWKTSHIDSRSVSITNKKQLQALIDDHGEDSDVAKVRVKGQFPSQSFKQFISEEDIDAAFGRFLRPEQYNFAPKIITVDPAWEGDDELIIAMRQGLMFQILERMPKNDNDILVAGKVARYEDERKADAVFIDGGYGTGIISAGRTMGREWQIVWFAGASTDQGCANKRAEMWNNMKQWFKEGGAIPPIDALREELTSPETVPRLDGKIQLESKKDMKRRGMPSPNMADALCLSFAFPVVNKATDFPRHHANQHNQDYDPFSKDRLTPASSDYNPFA